MPVKLTERLRCVFSDDEQVEHGKLIARAAQKWSELEQQKKEIDAQIKGEIEQQKSIVQRLSSAISMGYEYRDVETHFVMDTPSPGTKTVVRVDTGEVLRTEPMTSSEKQGVLSFDQPDPVWPKPVQDDLYDDAISMRVTFPGGAAEIRMLEIANNAWISAVSWKVGARERFEPLRSVSQFDTRSAAVSDAAKLIFDDMTDFVLSESGASRKLASSIQNWAESLITKAE